MHVACPASTASSSAFGGYGGALKASEPSIDFEMQRFATPPQLGTRPRIVESRRTAIRHRLPMTASSGHGRPRADRSHNM
jgi:hypothetical protein